MFESNIFAERQIADQLNGTVDRFKVISTHPYNVNFRCDICGDSRKNKFKARAYIYEEDGHLHFKCHNCGEAHFLTMYLKMYHPNLYDQYQFELMSGKSQANNITAFAKDQKAAFNIANTPTKPFNKFEPLAELTKVSQLPETNRCRQYVLSRKIPTNYHYKLFYVEKFYHWINKWKPDKFSKEALAHDGPRLVIPFLDRNSKCFGVTGRALEEVELGRYITILFDEDKPKIFGVDTVNPNEKVYILEGAIDSMFIPNSLAFNGIDGDIPIKNAVLVLDNEPRNKQVLDKYAAYIAQDYSICIWPEDVAEKDVNEMVLAGRSPEQIKQLIDDNTYQGMFALLAFNAWKKLETK